MSSGNDLRISSIVTLERPIVSFDIESTGTDCEKDRIISMTALKELPGGETIIKDWMLNPGVPIPPASTEIHKITDEDVKDCPFFVDRAQEIFDFFGNCDLMGFNCSNFDLPMLQMEFARVGMEFEGISSRKVIDLQKIFHMVEPRNLSAAVKKYLGEEHAGAHTSFADVMVLPRILLVQLNWYPQLLTPSVAALSEVCRPSNWVDSKGMLIRKEDARIYFTFGKHNDRPVDEVILLDPSYINWVLSANFSPDVKKCLREAFFKAFPPTV